MAPVAVNPKPDRPSSQLSQNGSSGYGSTRSQSGPLTTAKCGNKSPTTESDSSSSAESNNNSNSRAAAATIGFRRSITSSMRCLTHKKIIETAVCRAKQINPQFASLRIPNRIKAAAAAKEDEVEPSAAEVDRELSEEIDAGIDLVEAEVEEEKRAAAASATGLVVVALPADADGCSPVPAPRQHRESHPYMNMQPTPQQSQSQHSPIVPNTLRPAVSVKEMQVRLPNPAFVFSVFILS